MARHELKCWPTPFQLTLEGLKPWELRRNDRGFKVGDELLLQEWNRETVREGGTLIAPQGYTGRELLVRVDYIMDSACALFVALGWENVSPLAPGYVIMSTSPVKEEKPVRGGHGSQDNC